MKEEEKTAKSKNGKGEEAKKGSRRKDVKTKTLPGVVSLLGVGSAYAGLEASVHACGLGT
ncbi:MAG: hypothetical protein LBK13_13840 [Spirochaetales bacterium]|jgi:hypothetical protein|nr:hypothetical protein [Spirochaetales bacterium]